MPIAAAELDNRGIAPEDIFQHQAVDTFASRSPCNHGFVVVRLSDGHSYWVDATFRQFFHGTRPFSDSADIGERIYATARGRQIANAVMRQGFVRLDDEGVNLLAVGFDASKKNFTLAELHRNTAGKAE